MSFTQKTTQDATYHYETAGELRCRYHDGRTRRAVLVLVTRLDTQARYSVLLPVDGHGASCDCPHYQKRLKGTSEAAVGCKHISGALGHVLAEAQASAAETFKEAAEAARQERQRPAEVAPAILAQIGTTGEVPEWRERGENWLQWEIRLEAEREQAEEQERLARAERDRALLWPANEWD